MGIMNIWKSILNLKPEIIKNNSSNSALEGVSFYLLISKSLGEAAKENKKEANLFPGGTISSPLFNPETFSIEMKAEGQDSKEESRPAEGILKENMLPEKINLETRYREGDSIWEYFISLFKGINTALPQNAADFLARQGAAADQLGGPEAKGEADQKIWEMEENKIMFSFAKQNGSNQISIAEEAIEKLDLFSFEEKDSLNLSPEETKVLNGARGDNLDFGSFKSISLEEMFATRSKESAIWESLLNKEKIKNALMEMPEDKLKDQQTNLALLTKEKIAPDMEEALRQDIKNNWLFSVKEEKRSPSSLAKENKFEQFKLWGKDFPENLGGRTDPDLDNFPALDRNLTFSFFKGERKGNIKLDYFSPFSPEAAGKDTILGPHNLAETGEVWGQENLSQWRPAETEIYKQITQRIIWSVKNDQELIKVTLEPPHLGNIYIEVTREKENIRAKILAENPLTKELIEHNYWPIQKIIEKEGFRLERFDVFSPFDMDFSGEAKGGHLSSKSQDRVYHAVGEIEDQICLENSLRLETNNGGINILI